MASLMDLELHSEELLRGRERKCVRAYGFWEFPITKGRRVCIPIDDGLVDYGVNLVRGDSGADVGCSEVKDLAPQLGKARMRGEEDATREYDRMLTRHAVRIFPISSGLRIRGG